ncbi:FlgJ Muramidase (flagellum-specific) [uncultured Caudovirales phage]|uniref:FlgJ Muramidase (Flagellum-specific) n=1 Tax=uncultured Caudovirales phage TaxID=2100421 RepID=A0A6J5NW55_9CAUD|nr:FlgJ Muramidase (flagellum-specific) [uncultured Caudovirales phage]
MKKIKVFLFLIVLLCSFVTPAQKEYFEKYQGVADSLEKRYGIPSSIMLAIAFHESGAGKSRNAKLLHNHFGITGSNDLKRTHNITSRYKQFSSVVESYAAFCQLVAKRAYYAELKGTTDVKKWVTTIAKSGYAGSSVSWAEKIKWIISHYKLN